MKKYSDQELLSLLKVYDKKAQAYFYQSYFLPMVLYAMRWVRQDAAEDTASECLMIAMGISINFGTLRHLVNHTYTSVRNACINDWRKDNTRKKAEANINYSAVHEGTALDIEKMYVEMIAQVSQGLKDLPPEMAAIIQSYYLEEKTITEIRMELGISKNNNVVQKKRRALALLRTFLKL